MKTVLDRAFDPETFFTTEEIGLITPIAQAVASIRVADERTIRQSIGALSSALPAQSKDEAGSKLQLNTYMAMLAGCDERALAHACRRCLDELDWMPTIHQLKERMCNWISPEAVAISRARAIMRAGRRAAADDGKIDLPEAEIDRVNAFLRTRGVATRIAPDGSTYQDVTEDERAAA